MVPGHVHAHPHDPAHSHVTLHTSSTRYLPGHLVTVTVRSSRDFMGFLLQARSVERSGSSTKPQRKVPGSSGMGPVLVGGSWTLTPPWTHTIRCVSDGDTVTHSDKQLKRNLSFVWRAPDVPSGDVKFYITVVQSYFVYWTGIRSPVLHDGTRSWWRGSFASMTHVKTFDQASNQEHVDETANTSDTTAIAPATDSGTTSFKRDTSPSNVERENTASSTSVLHNNTTTSNVKTEKNYQNDTNESGIGVFVRPDTLAEVKTTQTNSEDIANSSIKLNGSLNNEYTMSLNETRDSEGNLLLLANATNPASLINDVEIGGKDANDANQIDVESRKLLLNSTSMPKITSLNIILEPETSTKLSSLDTTQKLTNATNQNLKNQLPFSLTKQNNDFAQTDSTIVPSMIKSGHRQANLLQNQPTTPLTLSDVTPTSPTQRQKFLEDNFERPVPDISTKSWLETFPLTNKYPLTHSSEQKQLLVTSGSVKSLTSKPAKAIKDLPLLLDASSAVVSTTIPPSLNEATQSFATNSSAFKSVASSNVVPQTFSIGKDPKNISHHRFTIASKSSTLSTTNPILVHSLTSSSQRRSKNAYKDNFHENIVITTISTTSNSKTPKLVPSNSISSHSSTILSTGSHQTFTNSLEHASVHSASQPSTSQSFFYASKFRDKATTTVSKDTTIVPTSPLQNHSSFIVNPEATNSSKGTSIVPASPSTTISTTFALISGHKSSTSSEDTSRTQNSSSRSHNESMNSSQVTSIAPESQSTMISTIFASNPRRRSSTKMKDKIERPLQNNSSNLLHESTVFPKDTSIVPTSQNGHKSNTASQHTRAPLVAHSTFATTTNFHYKTTISDQVTPTSLSSVQNPTLKQRFTTSKGRNASPMHINSSVVTTNVDLTSTTTSNDTTMVNSSPQSSLLTSVLASNVDQKATAASTKEISSQSPTNSRPSTSSYHTSTFPTSKSTSYFYGHTSSLALKDSTVVPALSVHSSATSNEDTGLVSEISSTTISQKIPSNLKIESSMFSKGATITIVPTSSIAGTNSYTQATYTKGTTEILSTTIPSKMTTSVQTSPLPNYSSINLPTNSQHRSITPFKILKSTSLTTSNSSFGHGSSFASKGTTTVQTRNHATSNSASSLYIKLATSLRGAILAFTSPALNHSLFSFRSSLASKSTTHATISPAANLASTIANPHQRKTLDATTNAKNQSTNSNLSTSNTRPSITSEATTIFLTTRHNSSTNAPNFSHKFVTSIEDTITSTSSSTIYSGSNLASKTSNSRPSASIVISPLPNRSSTTVATLEDTTAAQRSQSSFNSFFYTSYTRPRSSLASKGNTDGPTRLPISPTITATNYHQRPALEDTSSNTRPIASIANSVSTSPLEIHSSTIAVTNSHRRPPLEGTTITTNNTASASNTRHRSNFASKDKTNGPTSLPNSSTFTATTFHQRPALEGQSKIGQSSIQSSFSSNTRSNAGNATSVSTSPLAIRSSTAAATNSPQRSAIKGTTITPTSQSTFHSFFYNSNTKSRSRLALKGTTIGPTSPLTVHSSTNFHQRSLTRSTFFASRTRPKTTTSFLTHPLTTNSSTNNTFTNSFQSSSQSTFKSLLSAPNTKSISTTVSKSTTSIPIFYSSTVASTNSHQRPSINTLAPTSQSTNHMYAASSTWPESINTSTNTTNASKDPLAIYSSNFANSHQKLVFENSTKVFTMQSKVNSSNLDHNPAILSDNTTQATSNLLLELYSTYLHQKSTTIAKAATSVPTSSKFNHSSTNFLNPTSIETFRRQNVVTKSPLLVTTSSSDASNSQNRSTNVPRRSKNDSSSLKNAPMTTTNDYNRFTNPSKGSTRQSFSPISGFLQNKTLTIANFPDLPTPLPISSPPNVASNGPPIYLSTKTISSTSRSPLSTKSPSSQNLRPSAARRTFLNQFPTTSPPTLAQKPLNDVALTEHGAKSNPPISRISQNTDQNSKLKPNVEVKAKLPPNPPPDREGKYPDIVPRHSAWELGMLLGCSAGLGMVLVVGIRYVHRQACGKRTEVTLHDREREYSRGERGLIHVQECGDLVRVRRIRENSFVLLAEYDILASGD